MKILHVADLHLGKKLLGESLIDDQSYVLEQIEKIVKTEKPDLIIAAGDIYDKSIPPIEAVELANKHFTNLIDNNIPIVIISGNHDSSKRLGIFSDVLKRENFYIITDFEDSLEAISFEFGNIKLNVFATPFSEPLVVSSKLGEKLKTHDDVYAYLSKEWESKIDKSELNILVAHGFFGANSLTSDSERPLSIGGTEIVDTAYLKDFDYCALGHLHRSQKVSSNAYYSGSIMKYSFSEHDDNKSVNIVNIDDRKNITVENIALKTKRDIRIVNGFFEEIIKLDRSYDYVSVDLLDDGFVDEAFYRIKNVFPNLLKLNFTKKELQFEKKEFLEDIRSETSAEDKFKSFFRHTNGKEIDEESMELINSYISTILSKENF